MFLRINSSLRNWIFISLTLITICISLLIEYLKKLYNQNSEKKIKNRIKTIKDFNYNKGLKNKDIDIIIENAINRSNLLKNNLMYFSQKKFKQRKEFFYQDKIDFFSQKFKLKKSELMNQNKNGEMMKKNILNVLYYILLLIGGGYFFNCFILLKVPFNLTFFSMIQQRLYLFNINIFYHAFLWFLFLIFFLNSLLQYFNENTNCNNLNKQKEMKNQSSNLIDNPMNEANNDKKLKSKNDSFNIFPDLFFINNSVDKLIQISEGRV